MSEQDQAVEAYAEQHLGDAGCEPNEGAERPRELPGLPLLGAAFDILRQAVDRAAADHDRARAEYFEELR